MEKTFQFPLEITRENILCLFKIVQSMLSNDQTTCLLKRMRTKNYILSTYLLQIREFDWLSLCLLFVGNSTVAHAYSLQLFNSLCD